VGGKASDQDSAVAELFFLAVLHGVNFEQGVLNPVFVKCFCHHMSLAFAGQNYLDAADFVIFLFWKGHCRIEVSSFHDEISVHIFLQIFSHFLDCA
jgi:hypothetical protein